MLGPVTILVVIVGAAAAWFMLQNGSKPGAGSTPARGSKLARQPAAAAAQAGLKGARSRKGEFGRRSV